jgi:DNA-binding transcriptional MerR regulator
MSNNDDSRLPRDTDVFWVDDDGVHPPPPADTVLSIENVARMFNVSRLMLRHYEVRGLIKRRHRVGRTRVYGWADCDRIAFILKVRRAGLTLGSVMPILAAADDVLADRKFGQERCLELIAGLERRRKAFDEGLAELRHLYALLSGKSADNDRLPSREASHDE